MKRFSSILLFGVFACADLPVTSPVVMDEDVARSTDVMEQLAQSAQKPPVEGILVEILEVTGYARISVSWTEPKKKQWYEVSVVAGAFTNVVQAQATSLEFEVPADSIPLDALACVASASGRGSGYGVPECVSWVLPAADTTAAPPAGGLWPNEPEGMPRLTDVDWSTLSNSGWTWAQHEGTIGIGSDADEPVSPAGVLEMVYPKEFPSWGTDPGFVEMPLGSGYREMYVAFTMKLSSNWVNHDCGCASPKIAFFFFPIGSGADNLFFLMRQGDGRLTWGYNDANRARTEIRPGQWYSVEAYMRLPSSAGAADGILRWWIDGQLDGEHTGLDRMNTDASSYHGAAVNAFQFAPTWGGVGGEPVPAEQFIRIGHTTIRGR